MISALNQPTFEQIVAQYDQKIYALCWYLLKNKPDAQDCTQDIFISIFLNLSTIKEPNRLNSWVYQISVRKCYEFVRRRRRKKRFGINVPIDDFFSQTLPSHQKNPEELQIAAEKSLFFWRAVEGLPIQQQLAYTLYNIEDLSYKEIALAMKTSVSAVESLLYRARQTLAKELEKYHSDERKFWIKKSS